MGSSGTVRREAEEQGEAWDPRMTTLLNESSAASMMTPVAPFEHVCVPTAHKKIRLYKNIAVNIT